MPRASLGSTLLLLLFGLLPYTTVQGQEAHTFGFLLQPPSAQSLAMGGKVISYIDANPGLALDNPALYGHEVAGRMFLSYFNYMRGTHSANALYGLPVGKRGAWAIALRSTYYGKMQGYDTQGVATAPFQAMEMALSGLYSYDLTDRLRGGLALKMLYGQIERYSAFALVADAGLSYYRSDWGTSLGMTISNVGGMLKSYGLSRRMPQWDIRLGMSQRLAHAPIRFHLTLHGLTPYNIQTWGAGRSTGVRIASHFAGGVEYVPSEQFWVGIGYNAKQAVDLSERGAKSLSGLSAGVGFNQRHYRLALGATYYNPQMLGLMFSFSTTFGNDKYVY